MKIRLSWTEVHRYTEHFDVDDDLDLTNQEALESLITDEAKFQQFDVMERDIDRPKKVAE